jgi:hypothetical protein
MAVNFNISLSTHRSGANRVQKQKFGSIGTANATRDHIGLSLKNKTLKLEDAIEKIKNAIISEDKNGKMILNHYLAGLQGNPKK